MRIRSRMAAAMVAVHLAVACSPAAEPTPSAGGSDAPGSGIAIAAPPDVLTYRGSMSRTGVMPGPAPHDPVLLWRRSVPGALDAAPLVADDEIVVAGRDGFVRAFDHATGAPVWELALPAALGMTPTIADGRLHAVDDAGTLHVVDLEVHDLAWSMPGFAADSQVSVTDDGTILVGAEGALVALAPDGKERWRAPMSDASRSAVRAGLAVATGFRTAEIGAVTLPDGTGAWRMPTGAIDGLTPAIDEQGVVVGVRDAPGGHNRILTSDHAGNDGGTWSPPAGERIEAVAVGPDRLYAVTGLGDPAIQAIDRASLETRWAKPLAGDKAGVLVLVDGEVWVPTIEAVVAFDTASGTEVARVPTAGRQGAWIAVTGGLLIAAFTAADGTGTLDVYASADDPRVAAAHASPIVTPPPSGPRAAPVVTAEVVSATEIDGAAVMLLLQVAEAPDGTVYVADQAGSRIAVLAPDGTQTWWGRPGAAPGLFDFTPPTPDDGGVAIAISPDGHRIAVGEAGNHRIQLFDADREVVDVIGREGRGDGRFLAPTGLAIDSTGRLWVVDGIREDVQVFTPDGVHLRTFGGADAGAGALRRPAGLVVDEHAGEVLIADFAHRRVAIFDLEGTFLREVRGGSAAAGTAFDEVNAVAIDDAGHLLVIDTTSRLHVLDRATGETLGILAPELPGLGSVDAAGFLYTRDGRLVFADIGERSGTPRLIVLRPDLPPAPGAGD